LVELLTACTKRFENVNTVATNEPTQLRKTATKRILRINADTLPESMNIITASYIMKKQQHPMKPDDLYENETN